jgi:hypothetical protein
MVMDIRQHRKHWFRGGREKQETKTYPIEVKQQRTDRLGLDPYGRIKCCVLVLEACVIAPHSVRFIQPAEAGYTRHPTFDHTLWIERPDTGASVTNAILDYKPYKFGAARNDPKDIALRLLCTYLCHGMESSPRLNERPYSE